LNSFAVFGLGQGQAQDLPITCLFKKSHSGVSRINNIACVQAIFYTLTPWSRVLLEKLIVAQMTKKLPPFYVT
jgi:hypothetical protein